MQSLAAITRKSRVSDDLKTMTGKRGAGSRTLKCHFASCQHRSTVVSRRKYHERAFDISVEQHECISDFSGRL